MLDEARRELRRVLDALAPAARAGTWIVGLEPSCIYTLRDEAPALLPGDDADVVSRACSTPRGVPRPRMGTRPTLFLLNHLKGGDSRCTVIVTKKHLAQSMPVSECWRGFRT